MAQHPWVKIRETEGKSPSSSCDSSTEDYFVYSTEATKSRQNEAHATEKLSVSEPLDIDCEEKEDAFSVPAALVGTLAGFIVGGPVLAVAGGIGAAYASSTEEAADQMKREAGGAAQYIGDKAVEFDEKHRFIDHTKESMDKAWTKICEYDDKHNTSKEVQRFFSNALNCAEEWEKNNGFVENMFLSVADSATSVGKSFTKATKSPRESNVKGENPTHVRKEN